MHTVAVLAQQTTQTTVSLTAVWIAAGVALLGALIAAGTAQWRQRVELKHGRELADLNELRKVLDEAAALTYVVTERLIPVFHAWVHREAPSGVEAVEEVTPLLKQMDSMGARLALRLGESHPVSVTFAQYRLACGDIVSAIVTTAFQPPDEDQAGVGSQLEHLRRAFLEACQRVVGSRINERRS